MITQEQLKEALSYDPSTGYFRRLKHVRCHSEIKIGDIAGGLGGHGYVYIKISGVRYSAHRLAWLYMYGATPKEIDHINHDRADNRIKNLRNITRSENAKNKSMYKSNTSGENGVNYCKNSKKWVARIQVDGERFVLGRFKDKIDAIACVRHAKKDRGFHGNHGL